MSLDPGQALVVMDALLEAGEATLAGRRTLRAGADGSPPRANPEARVHDFPRREVEFHAAPEALEQVRAQGGKVELPGFGTFEVRKELVFHSAPGLRARLIKTPAARFVAATLPYKREELPKPEVRRVEPKKSWWRRLFS